MGFKKGQWVKKLVLFCPSERAAVFPPRRRPHAPNIESCPSPLPSHYPSLFSLPTSGSNSQPLWSQMKVDSSQKCWFFWRGPERSGNDKHSQYRHHQSPSPPPRILVSALWVPGPVLSEHSVGVTRFTLCLTATLRLQIAYPLTEVQRDKSAQCPIAHKSGHTAWHSLPWGHKIKRPAEAQRLPRALEQVGG